ncbi:KGK domain-containing protein [Acaryochloris thomasi]|uniref:KGK domain-containing protein n=1 Tax=Acaryochloris thomasi TaxID=2929456 RepID=UPI000DA6B7B2|nr:KGK domain-containing protein [Acaryochloris thomasi]
MQKNSVILSSCDVISPIGETKSLPYTFKAKELLIDLKDGWARSNQEKLVFSEGFSCHVLRPNGEGWQTGKFRVVIEFCPDSPEEATDEPAAEQASSTESPLDALRQETTQVNGHG